MQWFGSAKRTLIGRVATAFLLLAGLLAVVPAQAQTTCNAPSFGGERQVWAGTVTVAAVDAVDEISAGYGYALSSTMSALTPASPYTTGIFTIGTFNANIGAVVAQTGDDLVFAIRARIGSGSDAILALPANVKAALTLHVCDQPYTFSAATESADIRSFILLEWDVDLDWSSESSRTIKVSLQPNRVATGQPTIRGTATIGSTLTAAKGTIADADGVPAESTFTYQWVRVDGASETDISGATLNTYALSAADVGKKIKVKVGFTDDLTGEEELLSAATRTVPPGTLPSTPQLRSATASFSTVTLTYDRTLNSSSVPDKAHFTTSVGTVPERFKCGSGDTAGTDCFSQPANPTITNVTVRGSAVVLTLSAPYPLRYLPRIGEWIPGMYVKYTRRTNTIQSQGGVPTDRSCGQAHIGIPRVSHWRLLGCWHVKGGKNYTGTGVPVTLTSGSLGQLVPNHITDIQISEAGDDNQWENGQSVDIRVTFGGTAKFANSRRPSIWTPGWCQSTSTTAQYVSGANSASLVFRCTIINGPYTSLRLAPNSVHDGSNTLRISGTVTEYSYDYSVHADLRHGAVVKELPPGVPPFLTSATAESNGREIELVFSEHIDLPATHTDAVAFLSTLKSAFVVTAGGSTLTITQLAALTLQRNELSIFVSPNIGQGQAVVVSYTDPTAGDDAVALQDAAGNETASFTTGMDDVPAVTNNSTVDKTPPSLVSATVESNGWDIELVFSEHIDLPATHTDAVAFLSTLKSAFAVTAGGSTLTITQLAALSLQRNELSIFVSPNIGQGQAVVVSYTDPTAGDDAVALQDAAGNETASFTTGMDDVPAATNGSTVSMQREAPTITGSPALSESGSDGVWAPGETVDVTLTFSEAVTVDTTGGTPSIGLDLGGTESRSATYLRGSGTTELDFGYTLTTTDGSHTSMLVPIDSLALNGGAIRSQATGADAALSHNGAAMGGSTGPRGEGDPFTARFEGLPQNHNGSDSFTVELHFSEAPNTLSYTTVASGLLDVSGATVNGARRLTAGSNVAWEVTMTPSQSGDISIRLPARACTATNAVCAAGGRALANAVSATVEGVPLTASFSGVPAEHDGDAFDVGFHLSEEPRNLSFRTIQSALFDVTGGSIKKASRLRPGKNKGWTLKLDPSGLGDVTVRVKPTTACDAPPGVCTPDGRKLAGGLEAAIAGPAVLSVADAEVDEAEGATLDFVATLSRARNEATSVDYATSDGTATAGSDYTAASGTLTFTAGETSKAVSVAVLDDSHDEGSETMTFTLSNASGARLDDAEATGTINNNDAMPKAWMVRFGRTVGSQVVDALTQRLDGAGASHVTVAGINVIGESGGEPEAEGDDPFGLPAWAKNAERAADARTITADDLLLRSAFHLSSGRGEGPGAGPAFTAWGRVATGAFEAVEDDVAMDGDVTTGLVGFDAEWERALAGIMFSQSSGDGAYRLDPELGNDAGTVESSLTGVYPYARIDLNAKVSAWALAGVGSGELTLHQTGEKAMPTDISMRMGAVGVKGEVLDGSGPSGIGLNVKSDAMWVGTKSADTSELAPTEGDVTRLRLILQGERSFEVASSATFTPSAEVGLRHDGGDAETGTGVEVGAGLRYTVGAVTIEAQARTLVAHEDSDYEEWGASGAIRVNPSASGRGLTLSIAPAWGRTGSAAERLWSAHDARTLGADSEFEADSRIEIDTGYGFGLPHGRGVLTPYAGMTLGDAGTRTMRTGTRWQLNPDTVVSVEATRQASDAGEADNEVRLRAALRF